MPNIARLWMFDWPDISPEPDQMKRIHNTGIKDIYFWDKNRTKERKNFPILTTQAKQKIAVKVFLYEPSKR